ncbi:MAG TPA: hypothetical protein VFJ82_06905 [Longimicrobium sp.]|nr:hypothetical protein [Longimicrobium sp.]
MNDYIGFYGERIFERLISALHTPNAPLFTPHFLGDKWPVVDYIVRLEGAPGQPYFFVQVKTTRRGCTPSGRLQARVTAEEMRALAACPGPTYIAGVDEPTGSCYIVSANGERSAAMSTLPTAFPLDRNTREALWQEVASYWAQRGPHAFTSRFVDPRGSR